MVKKKKREPAEQVTPYDEMIDRLGDMLRWTWLAKEKMVCDASTVIRPRYEIETTSSIDASPIFVVSDLLEAWETNRKMVRFLLFEILKGLWMHGEAEALRQYEESHADSSH